MEKQIITDFEIKVISSGERKVIENFEIVTLPAETKKYTVTTYKVDDAHLLRRAVIQELNEIKHKLSSYEEFNQSLPLIDNLISTL